MRVRALGANVPILLDYLTVQVSDLFRDPEVFLALRRDGVPLLAAYPSIKVWVASPAAGDRCRTRA